MYDFDSGAAVVISVFTLFLMIGLLIVIYREQVPIRRAKP